MTNTIHDYFEVVTRTNHIEEFFADCTSVNNAAEAIAETYPLPDGITLADVADYIQADWDEC